MQIDTLQRASEYPDLTSDVAWIEAFDWLRNHQDNLPDTGEHKFGDMGLVANVQSNFTRARDITTFESHVQFIDLQYIASGQECIEWEPIESLQEKAAYDSTNDVTLYHRTTRSTTLLMTPGRWAIFLPHDGHMPNIQIGHSIEVHKVVIKIPVALFK